MTYRIENKFLNDVTKRNKDFYLYVNLVHQVAVEEGRSGHSL